MNFKKIRKDNLKIDTPEIEHLDICLQYPYPTNIKKDIDEDPIEYGKELFPLFKTINIETTSWCNYECSFCPSKVLDRKEEYMDTKLFQKIILELSKMNYTGEIRLHQSNEPLLDKDLENKVKFTKYLLPNVALGFTTNFSLMSFERLENFYLNGLNFLSVEAYKTEHQFDNCVAMAEKLKEKYGENIIIKAQAKDSKYSFSKEIENYKSKKLYITISRRYPKQEKEKFSDYNQSQITSRLGIVESKRKTKAAYCTRPFRSLQVNYNGKVILCCEEWVYTPDAIMGDLNKNSISEIWNGLPFFKYRETLQDPKGKRTLSPCIQCNFGGGIWFKKIRRVKLSNKQID